MARKQGYLFIAIMAIIVPIAINWSEAQKTVSNSARRTSWSSEQQQGSQPGAVYGGYSTQRQQSAIAAPANRRTSFPKSQTSYQSVAQAPAPAPVSIQSSQSSYQEEAQGSEADAEPASYGSVNGKPGVDFPAFTQVPKTSFSCDGLPYDYGMYADEETGCQAYHVCYNGRKDSFLCGVGTVFNQRILHCDYWYSVDCGKSSQYYSSNAYMGSSQPEPGPAQASGSSSYQSSSSQSSSSSNRPNSVYGGYQPQSSVQSFSRTQQQKTSFRQQPVSQEETNY